MMRVSASVLICLVVGVGLTACGGNDGDGDDTPQVDARFIDCGDDICDVSELDSCPADCARPPICDNDNTCDPGEQEATCNDCVPQQTCDNDTIWAPGETAVSCPADCGATCNNNSVC